MAKKLLSLFFLKISFFVAIAILLIACNDKSVPSTSYFGGQIINPKSDKVYFYKNEQLLDSAQLTDNKFAMHLENYAQGLYTFKHGYEYQYVYLEPNDSLLIRLNTWDFDESLVFSGKGAERNNFLINLFLVNQKQNRSCYSFFTLKDSLFKVKADSLLQVKNLLYAQFKEDVPENSPLFDKLVNTAIQYPIYTKKEIYPYNHMKAMRSKEHPKMSQNFFAFREKIDLNDDDLHNFYPHQNYVRAYLHHLAYKKQVLDSFKSDIDVNMMQAAAENIDNEAVKNKFLYMGIWFALLNENTVTHEKERALRLFLDHSTDKKRATEISNLIAVSKNLPTGFAFPKIKPKNFDGETVDLDKITKDRKFVIYTWPTKTHEINNLAKRVNYLENKYPDYLFIGLTSAFNETEWKKLIKRKKLNKNNQYILEQGIDWLDINFPRAILTGRDGKVHNNMTHLAHRGFEKQLAQLE